MRVAAAAALGLGGCLQVPVAEEGDAGGGAYLACWGKRMAVSRGELLALCRGDERGLGGASAAALDALELGPPVAGEPREVCGAVLERIDVRPRLRHVLAGGAVVRPDLDEAVGQIGDLDSVEPVEPRMRSRRQGTATF